VRIVLRPVQHTGHSSIDVSQSSVTASHSNAYSECRVRKIRCVRRTSHTSIDVYSSTISTLAAEIGDFGLAASTSRLADWRQIITRFDALRTRSAFVAHTPIDVFATRFASTHPSIDMYSRNLHHCRHHGWTTTQVSAKRVIEGESCGAW